MYDIGTQLVNRLKGELSSAFVDVAESNAKAQDDDSSEEILMSLSDSGIYEKMPTMSSDGERVSIIEAQSATAALHRHRPIVVEEDDQQQQSSTTNEQRISISSGYSVIKR